MDVEARRDRLESVTSGMPASLWSLVILSGLITMTATLFFDTSSFRMHFWMTCLLSTLLGLTVFLVGTLDNPSRGKVSIGSGSLQRVYEPIMVQHVSPAMEHCRGTPSWVEQVAFTELVALAKNKE